MELTSKTTQPISILLVDDDQTARDLLTTVINIKFPEVVVHFAGDGRSGLAAFKLHSPDITVTDIAMPIMDGIAMAAEIKALQPDAVVIALTAYSETQDLLNAIEIGIDHYLLKPLSLEKFLALTDKIVASKLEKFQRERYEETLRLSEERHKNELMLANNLLEQRIRERTADLEQTLHEQEAFCYTISHDLRAPLRHINSYCAMLMEDHGEALSREMRGYLERACDASTRMGLLIDHLLELARMSRAQIKPEAVNLSEMAHQILAIFQETDVQRSVECTVVENAIVFGDRLMLEQLMNNLLGNAWKYTSKTSTGRIEFGMTRVAEEVAYFVKDNGAGFDMAYHDRLFNAFERLHGPEFDGDGIGLVIAQRVIRRHGGSIWAEGKVGEGASFYFTLPVFF